MPSVVLPEPSVHALEAADTLSEVIEAFFAEHGLIRTEAPKRSTRVIAQLIQVAIDKALADARSQ